jgi:hypothetical protein
LDSLSEPYWRDIFTRILSPNLASQAPNVRRIRDVVGIAILIIVNVDGENITNLNSIPSKHNNAINRCDEFKINEIIMNVKANSGSDVVDVIRVENMVHSLIYKIRAFVLSYQLFVQFTRV